MDLTRRFFIDVLKVVFELPDTLHPGHDRNEATAKHQEAHRFGYALEFDQPLVDSGQGSLIGTRTGRNEDVFCNINMRRGRKTLAIETGDEDQPARGYRWIQFSL